MTPKELFQGQGVIIEHDGETAWMCHEYNVGWKDLDLAHAAARDAGYTHLVDDYHNNEGDLVLILRRKVTDPQLEVLL